MAKSLSDISAMQAQHFGMQQWRQRQQQRRHQAPSKRHLHQAGGGGVEARRTALQHRHRQLRPREAAGAQRLLRPRQRVTHLRWPSPGVERANPILIGVVTWLSNIVRCMADLCPTRILTCCSCVCIEEQAAQSSCRSEGLASGSRML